ncbi:hypothetical protein chiPu_0033896, partial [Chiloscyllium punctatum]|nr:hypothetical protein [Chiloscyllium punctatum]
MLQEIEGRIQTDRRLCPPAPVEDAPLVDIADIALPSPPGYKPGDK